MHPELVVLYIVAGAFTAALAGLTMRTGPSSSPATFISMSICLLWPLLLWPVLSAFGEAALRRPAANLGSDEFADMSMTLEAEQEKDMTQQVRQTETSATTEATSVADYIVERLAGAGSRLRARPVEGHVWRDALAIGNDSCANS